MCAPCGISRGQGGAHDRARGGGARLDPSPPRGIHRAGEIPVGVVVVLPHAPERIGHRPEPGKRVEHESVRGAVRTGDPRGIAQVVVVVARHAPQGIADGGHLSGGVVLPLPLAAVGGLGEGHAPPLVVVVGPLGPLRIAHRRQQSGTGVRVNRLPAHGRCRADEAACVVVLGAPAPVLGVPDPDDVAPVVVVEADGDPLGVDGLAQERPLPSEPRRPALRVHDPHRAPRHPRGRRARRGSGVLEHRGGA